MLSLLYSLLFFVLGCVSPVLGRPLFSRNISPRGTFSGKASYYLQGGNPGACGKWHSDQDRVVALQSHIYANGRHCGATITLTDTKTGKTAQGVVADNCPGCKSTGDIDLSRGLFDVFASENDGTFPVSWRLD